MENVIVTVKITQQVSNEEWERITLAAIFGTNEPISNIITWAELKKGDIDTIQIHIDSNKENK